MQLGEPDTVLQLPRPRSQMVATVVALQLVEQGALDLDVPVAEYCPEFDELKVLTGFEGDQPRFPDPASRATIKQLMTHTSGLGIGSGAMPVAGSLLEAD